MLNTNLFTEEEKKMICRFRMKNEKALVKEITRMLPCLPAGEMETALTVIGKLQVALDESKRKKSAGNAAERFLSRLTAIRGYSLLGMSSQFRCFPV